MIRVVAMAAVINPDPHMDSAVTLGGCWSHESNNRQPASAGVETVIANNGE
jgi:hypothetical protein